jgi:hypothetical protein
MRSETSQRALITYFENNPVSSAFGISALKDASSTAAVEWDIHVRKDLVSSWEQAPDCLHPSRTCDCEKCSLLLSSVETALIAHGDPLCLLYEMLGLPHVYAAVSRLPLHCLGGLMVRQWLPLYWRAHALRRELQGGPPPPPLRVVLDVKSSISS